MTKSMSYKVRYDLFILISVRDSIWQLGFFKRKKFDKTLIQEGEQNPEELEEVKEELEWGDYIKSIFGVELKTIKQKPRKHVVLQTTRSKRKILQFNITFVFQRELRYNCDVVLILRHTLITLVTHIFLDSLRPLLTMREQDYATASHSTGWAQNMIIFTFIEWNEGRIQDFL